MSVHYDIEATSARLRAELAKVVADEKTSAASRIKFRNPEAVIAVNELMMRELNRGTTNEQLAAVVLELTSDMMLSLCGGDRVALLKSMPSLSAGFERKLLQLAMQAGTTPAARCAAVTEPGGHA